MLGDLGTAELGSHTSPGRIRTVVVVPFFRNIPSVKHRLQRTVGCPLAPVRSVEAVIFLT